MWWRDLTQDGDIVYGEYRLTLRFRDGYEKTYVHNLQDIPVSPVDENTMSYLVNVDGSIDFTFTNPASNQRHRIMIYQGGDRYLSKHVPAQTAGELTVNVSADELKCLQIGELYEWHVRAHDLNSPYNVTHKTFGLTPLEYSPANLYNRVTVFSAYHAISSGGMWLQFTTRPGSYDSINSAAVTGPEGFNYTFDLTEDWGDLSTETNILKGWQKNFSSFNFGEYTLNVYFADGHFETRTFNLQNVTTVPVDVATIRTYVFENGAGYCTWEIPPGGSGQLYQVIIRSADNSKEYYRSTPALDGTSQYASPWELRGLIPGESYQLFVRSVDAGFNTMGQSESIFTVNDPFELFPKPDINKDWDVDGSDVAVIAQLIEDGEIDDLPEAMDLISQSFGQVQ
jgi:hypothetical protein